MLRAARITTWCVDTVLVTRLASSILPSTYLASASTYASSASVGMALRVAQSDHPEVLTPEGLWQVAALAQLLVRLAPLAEVPPGTTLPVE